MIKSLFYFAVIIQLWAISVDAKNVRIFIVSGQSNAGGNGNGALLPAEYQTIDEEVLLYYETKTATLAPMAPISDPGNKYGAVTSFGPELLFSKKIKKQFPDDIIVVFKQSKGGTSIIAWDKNYDTQWWRNAIKQVTDSGDRVAEEQWPELTKTIRNGLQALYNHPLIDTTRDNISFCGFIWAQVEKDTKYAHDTIVDFQRDLTHLFQNIREETSTPDLACICMAPHNVSAENRAIIQADIDAVIANDVFSGVVKTDSLEKYPQPDPHFNTAGQIEFGKRYALEYLRIIGSSNISFSRKNTFNDRSVFVTTGSQIFFKSRSPEQSILWADIFDVQGTRITRISAREGMSMLTWNGKNSSDRCASSGRYAYRLAVEKTGAVRQITGFLSLTR